MQHCVLRWPLGPGREQDGEALGKGTRMEQEGAWIRGPPSPHLSHQIRWGDLDEPRRSWFSNVLCNIYILLCEKHVKPVHPKGDQSWVFIGRTDVEAETPIVWPPDVKNWLTWKDPDAGKEWGQEKGTTEDEMVGWHHWLDGPGFGWTPGVGDGQGGLRAAVHGVAKSRTRLSDWTELNSGNLFMSKPFWSKFL